MSGQMKVPDLSNLDPAWVAFVEIVHRIEQHPYHWPVGRVMFQKIAYVATSAGLPTRLNYQRGASGPFSSEFKLIEARLADSNLFQYQRSGGMIIVKPGLNFDFIKKDFEPYFTKWSSIIEKTVDLFMRVNTNQAKIIAIVLFVARELENGSEIPSESDVLEAVMQWKQKCKSHINSGEVALAIRHLAILRWLKVRPDASMVVPEEDFVFV